MKKGIILPILIGFVLHTTLFSQALNSQVWQQDFLISQTDFLAEVPLMVNDGNQMFFLDLDFDINLEASSIEELKEFSPNAQVSINRNNSWLEEGPNSQELITLSNLQFDLAEIYIREIKLLLQSSKKEPLEIIKQNILTKLRKFYDRKLEMTTRIIEMKFDRNVIQQYKNTIEKELLYSSNWLYTYQD